MVENAHAGRLCHNAPYSHKKKTPRTSYVYLNTNKNVLMNVQAFIKSRF